MSNTNIEVPQQVVEMFLEMDIWLRNRDRFSIPPFLEQQVQQFVSYKSKCHVAELDASHSFYRSRVHQPAVHDPYPATKMGAPPTELASPGRLNPEGIRYLYLADCAAIAIAEVRPWKTALLSVGHFVPRRTLRVSSLITPKSVLSTEEISEYGPGLIASILFEGLYVSAPTHRDDKHAYLPTQYIASKFKAAGVDGIQFESVLNDGGINTVLFDPEACECTDVEVYAVDSVRYEYHSKNI